jgi:hypothetical protein
VNATNLIADLPANLKQIIRFLYCFVFHNFVYLVALRPNTTVCNLTCLFSLHCFYRNAGDHFLFFSVLLFCLSH